MFLIFYALFMLGLVWFTPGYTTQVWNLAALSGVLVGGIPPEELFFGFSFGWYWTGVYEHFTWRTSVTLVEHRRFIRYRCHKIRASSRGTATPECSGITRAV